MGGRQQHFQDPLEKILSSTSNVLKDASQLAVMMYFVLQNMKAQLTSLDHKRRAPENFRGPTIKNKHTKTLYRGWALSSVTISYYFPYPNAIPMFTATWFEVAVLLNILLVLRVCIALPHLPSAKKLMK